MDTPTAEQVRARSPLLRERYPAPTGSDEESPDFLAAIVDSSALVAGWTGRLIAPAEVGEEVPAGLVPIALRAVARMSERMDLLTVAATASATISGTGNLRSISAGPWSESYFAPGELTLKNGVVSITGDTLLDALLWALMTEDVREAWMALATGLQPPAGAASGFDYRKQGGGYFGSVSPLGYGAGPDGW